MGVATTELHRGTSRRWRRVRAGRAAISIAMAGGESTGASGGALIRLMSGGYYAALGIIKGHQGGHGISSKIVYRPSGWTVY